MIEAGVVISKSLESIYWHTPQGRTGGSLPDSRDLWEVFWENRHNLSGFAHSHPGSGVPGPSHTDLTTFAAVEVGLGVRLLWWITSSDTVIEMTWCGPGKFDYEAKLIEDPFWAFELRKLSNI